MHKLRKLIALLGVVAISSTLVVSTATAAEWYEPYMQNLVDVGVDFGDPGSNTTRCEWASGVVAWNGLEADMPAEPTFLDVPETHECYEAVETAYAHGVLSGYSDSEGQPTGYFGPDDPITREQAAKMIVEGESLPVIEDSGVFPDESSFSSWATDAWYHSTVFAWNKMVGDSDTGMFRPGDNINHAEAAKVITIEAELSASYVEDDTTVDDVVSEGDLLVELSDQSPVGDTVPSKATSVEVAAWDFTAQNGDVVLDTVKVHTHGITSLPSGHAVYLYQGDDRLTSGKTVNSSTNLANFTNLDLLINDGETVTLFLRVDVGEASSTSEMGFEIEEAAAVDANDATVSGDFPLQGDTFGISTTSAGTLTIEKNGTIVNPKVGEDDVVIAKFKMAAATEAAEINQVGMLITGTVSNDSVENLELYVQGEADPIATVDSLNSKDIANFVLDTPYEISKGDTKTFTMKADFNTGRTDDTVKVYVDETTDVLAIGGTYGFGMAVDIDNASGYDGTSCTSASGKCSYSTLEGGDITVSSSGPTASDIATAGDDIHLLDFSIVSVSDVTFKNFPVAFLASESASDTTEGLLNSTASNFTDIKVVNVDTGETLLGPIDADTLKTALGGSTAITEAAGDDATAYVKFTDEFTMETGEELNLAVTADVENTATLDGMTIVAYLPFDSSNPEIRDINNKVITNTASLVPSSTITGKTMTVKSPSLTATLASVPTSNTRIKGEKDVPFTGISLECGSASPCKVTDVLLQGYLDENSDTTWGEGVDNSVYLNEIVGSVWLEDGNGDVVAAAQSVESDGDVQFNNMTWQLDAGESAIMYVVGDISADAYKNNDADKVAFGIETAGDIDYEDDDGNTRDNVGTVNTSQTTYVTTSDGGSLTVSVDASTPKEDIVVAGVADQEISKFKFTTTDEAFLVKKLSINARQSGVSAASNLGDYDNNISKITLSYTNSDGDTETKTGYLTNGTASFSGMDFYIGADANAVLTVSADVSSIAASQATAGEFIDLNVAFNNFEAVAQASGETYKGDKIDADVGSGSDLDFGTITYTDPTGLVLDGAEATVTLGSELTFDVDEGDGTAPLVFLPVGTVVCFDASTTYVAADGDSGTGSCDTSTADNVAIITGRTGGTTEDTYTALVVNDADGPMATDLAVYYALPGSGYLTAAKQMHVYETVPTLTLNSSSPSGNHGAKANDTFFEFDLAAESTEDVVIRKGTSYSTCEADMGGVSVNAANTTISVDGSSCEATSMGTAGDSILYANTEDLSSYDYVSFWLRWNDDSASDDLTADSLGVFTADAKDDTEDQTTVLSTSNLGGSDTTVFEEGTWVFVHDVAMPTGTDSSDTYIGIYVADNTILGDDLDDLYIDQFKVYNDKLVVNIASDASLAAGGNAQAIYLKGGTSDVTGYFMEDTTSAGSVTFIPTSDLLNSAGDTTTYSLETDTTTLISDTGGTDDIVSPSITYGSATDGTVTAGGLWWYDSNASVQWVGYESSSTFGSTLKY